MAQKGVIIYFPLSFKEVDIKNSSMEDLVGIIKKYDKKIALINDEHHCIKGEQLLARIRYDPSDKQCYYVQIPMGNKILRNIRLHYDDLQKLSVESSYDYSFFEYFREEQFLNPMEALIAEQPMIPDMFLDEK